MNDRIDFERLVNERFAREHDVRPPDRAVDEMLTRVGRTRPLPRWLALIKEPSMRYSSSLAVGSPTARVLAIMAATLLLTVALAAVGIAGTRLLAADASIIVDQAGGGDYTTISDAVAAAQDGDKIQVRPGTYSEAVAIDKDIAIAGDGPVDEVVISAPPDGPFFGDPSSDNWLYAMLLEGTDTTVSNLTFRGDGSALVVNGGSPVLSELVFDQVKNANEGLLSPDAQLAVAFAGGSTGALRDSTITDSDNVYLLRSDPLIENNTMVGGAGIHGHFGDKTVIRGNQIERPSGGGVVLRSGSDALIEGNTITNPRAEAGIVVWGAPPPGVGIPGNDPEPTVRDNVITTTGSRQPGILLEVRAGGTITGNTIDAATFGVTVLQDSTTEIHGNTICAGAEAFDVKQPNEVQIGENELCDAS